MGAQSLPVRQEAHLRSCPACGIRNGLNASRCWQCGEGLVPPRGEVLAAARDALAAATRGSDARTTILPSVAVACGLMPRATMRSRGVRLGAPSEAAPEGAALTGGERFGSVVVERAMTRRRPATAAAVALTFAAIVILGYPIYRGAERLSGAQDLRRAPFGNARARHTSAAPAVQPRDAGSAAQPRVDMAALAVGSMAAASGAMARDERIRPASLTEERRPSNTAVPQGRARPESAGASRKDAAKIAHHRNSHGLRVASRGMHPTPRAGTTSRPTVVAGAVSLHEAAIGR